MPFQPGQSGNPLGRPKGSCNETRRALGMWPRVLWKTHKCKLAYWLMSWAGKLHPIVPDGADGLR